MPIPARSVRAARPRVQFERKADHLDDMTGQRSVVPGVRWIQFDLTEEEASALRKLLADAIDYDRYPLSLRIQALRRILVKFEPLAPPPPPARPPTPGPSRRRPRQAASL
jgi:hypothetical protein